MSVNWINQLLLLLLGSGQTSDFHNQYCDKKTKRHCYNKIKRHFPAKKFFHCVNWKSQFMVVSADFEKQLQYFDKKKYCFIKILQYCFWKSPVWRRPYVGQKWSYEAVDTSLKFSYVSLEFNVIYKEWSPITYLQLFWNHMELHEGWSRVRIRVRWVHLRSSRSIRRTRTCRGWCTRRRSCCRSPESGFRRHRCFVLYDPFDCRIIWKTK